jgi:hypothetical protein
MPAHGFTTELLVVRDWLGRPQTLFGRVGLDAVAEQELLRAREFLDRRHQPHPELKVGFDCGRRSCGRCRS